MRTHSQSQLFLPPSSHRISGDHFAVFVVLVGFMCWASIDKHVPRDNVVGSVIALSIPGVALFVFAIYLAANRTGFGLIGTGLRRACLALFAAFGATYVINSGLQGPELYTRFFPFRLALVLLTGLVAYRMARIKIFTKRTIVFCSMFMTVLLLVSMISAKVMGVEGLTKYQEVKLVPGITGEPVLAYLLAFSIPGLALLRRTWLRYTVMGANLVAIMLTYKRGPMVCGSVALALSVLLARFNRDPPRTLVAGISIMAICISVALTTIGIEKLATRWVDLYEMTPRGLSERGLIYSTLLKGIVEDRDCLIFGHGIGSTVVAAEKSFGRSVFGHNDWLEIAYTAGLVGVISFLLINVQLLKGVWYLLKQNNATSILAVSAYVLFLIANITGGVMYAAQHGAYIFAILGAICGFADNSLKHHQRMMN